MRDERHFTHVIHWAPAQWRSSGRHGLTS